MGPSPEEDERFLPYLAITLNNLENALSDKGRLDEAIARYEEALKAVKGFTADRPWLALTLARSHIGIALAELLRRNVEKAR